MKKFITLLLMLSMIISLSACGQTSKPNQSEEIKEEEVQTLKDPVISITDGIDIKLNGEYTFFSGKEEDTYDTLGYYENVNDGEEFKAVGLYSWKKTATLKEEAEATLAIELPTKADETLLIENDFWKKRGDSHYYCFTVFDDTSCEYYQAFLFEEDDLIKEFSIWYNTKPVTIPDVGIESYIPVYAKEVELTKEDIDNNMFASYTFPDSFFVDVSFYEWDRNGYSVEDTINWYKKNTQNYEILDQYEYTSKESGKTYECVEVGFDYEYNGKPCACLELNVLDEDKMFALFFHTPEEEADEYLASTAMAMAYSFKKAQ